MNKVRCEQLLADEHATNGFPATSRACRTRSARVARSSPAYRFFCSPRAGAPHFLPAEGMAFVSLVHIADVAALMASILGNHRAAGRTYNVSGTEVASIAAAVHFMAKAVGVDVNIAPVPLEVARRQRPPLVHWASRSWAARSTPFTGTRRATWRPRFGLEDGYRALVRVVPQRRS